MVQKLLIIIRLIQFIILVIIIGFEIAQLVAFRDNRSLLSFPNVIDSAPLSPDGNVSWSAYFEEMNDVHGIKVFYYIVIILTLLCPQFFWKRFNKAPILNRDKYYEFFYLAIWVTVSFTNLKPIYSGTDLNCSDPIWGSQGYRCRLFISSEFFSCIMAVTWIISTCLLIIYIHKHKEEIADRMNERRSRRRSKKRGQKVNNDDGDENA
ncbi:hypothetical protein GLOIN_2v1543692 [Rhizophagus clarus]|uniref:MARVEL domain-containing protein n=1 Tax=Rhizophagus clarus TaxID=94130 RepID=A0A8H3LXX2_9GLOM|nr:hypothetical protein GLOIN_2v1543692 [Rhizophagus clarus]